MSQQVPPYGQWVKGAEWRRFWSIEDRWCFRRIGRDLAFTDIHPPLYFWLLHAWLVAFGVSTQSGPALNVVLALLTAAVLYSFVRWLTGSRAAALAGVLIWAVSPVVAEVASATRPYELIGLVSLVYFWQILRIADAECRPGAAQHALLALTATVGCLTHYHFAFVAAAGGLVGAWRLRRPPWRRLLAFCAALGAGALLFVASHPLFWRSLRAAGRWGTQPGGAADRLDKVRRTFSGFAGDGFMQKAWLVAAGLAVLMLLWTAWRVLKARGDEARARLLSAAAMLAISAGAVCALYVLSMSPRHAMGPRYLSMAWPLLAAVVTAALWRAKFGRFAALALCIAMTVAAALGLPLVPRPRATPLLRGDSLLPLVVDNVRRGVLPGTLWHVSPERPVFAAGQPYLLAHGDAWMPGLGRRCSYAGSGHMGNTEQRREEILKMLEPDYVVTPEKGYFVYGCVYVLQRKPHGQAAP